MNQFDYKGTKVIKSEFDFSKLSRKSQFSGQANVMASVGVPKDLDKKRIIQCVVDFSMGNDADAAQIRVKTVSVFDIIVLDNEAGLQSDAASVCLPETIKKVSEKISDLVEIHIGRRVNIPIPVPEAD